MTETTITTPTPLPHIQSLSLNDTYKERVAHEISIEVEHLSKLIKASQVRKNHLDTLLVELHKDTSSGSSTPENLCYPIAKTWGKVAGDTTILQVDGIAVDITNDAEEVAGDITNLQAYGVSADVVKTEAIICDMRGHIPMDVVVDTQGEINEEEAHTKDVDDADMTE